jgi:DNA-binding CsgD family transcriptional regulator
MIKDDHILDLIDEAVVDPARWPDALAAFAEAVDGAGAHLIVIDKCPDAKYGARPRFMTAGGRRMNPDTAVRYMEGWKEFDPLLPAAFHLSGPPGTILLCHEFLSKELVLKDAYFQEFLVPSGGRFQTGITLENDANHVTMLDVHSRNAPLERKRLAHWRPVIEHLRRSIHLSVRLAASLAEGHLLREVIDCQGIACIMVDECMHVFDQSAAGEKLLAQGMVLRVDAAGNLRLSDHTYTSRLKAIVASACRGHGGGMMHLGSTAASAVTIQVVSAGVSCGNPFNPARANSALVFIEQPSIRRVSNKARIRAALGCSAAEAEVAVVLATGASPQQIAADRRTSIYTVRAQIRALLCATASNRIAELVAKVVSL